MKIEKCQDVEPIQMSKKVKMVNMGNIVEIMSIDKINHNGLPIKKISKEQYMVNASGEVLDYEHQTNRTGNKDSLRKSFKKIRQLINYNFGKSDNELMCTLTYADNMQDTKKLYIDCEHFFKKLKRKYGDIDYISVVEPQGRGAWHCHVLLRFNGKKSVYIPNKVLNTIWGHGFVCIKAIKKVDNLGAYLSAYLGDIPLDECDFVRDTMNIKEVEIDGVKKQFVKGGRLHLYPNGMNIYRCSRGIKLPPAEWVFYKDVKKIVGTAIPNYTEMLKVSDNDGVNLNTIIYENYNMKR